MEHVSKITTLVVGLVVGITLIAGLMIPLAQTTTTTSEQNEGYTVLLTDRIGDYAYTVEDGNLLLNGEAINYVASSPNLGIASKNLGLSFRGADDAWFVSSEAGIANGTTAVTVYKNGSWESVKTGTTTTSDVDTLINSPAFFATNDGKYAQYEVYNVTPTIKINSGDALYFFFDYGQMVIDSTTYGLTFMGEYKDGVATVLYANKISSSAVEDITSDLTFTVTPQSSELDKGIITFEGFSVTVAYEGASVQAVLHCAAPLEYRVTTDNEYNTFILIIPTLLIIALIVAVAGYIRRP